MKRIKKYLAILLSLLMIMTSFPLSVFANNIEYVDMEGSNEFATWSYTASNRTLYINTNDKSGVLEYINSADTQLDYLPTYDGENTDVNDTWLDERSVENIIVGNKVKSIYATFSEGNYPYLKSVSFENDSVFECILDSQFNESTIESIEFPSSLKTIYDNAFLECHNLKAIKIPSSVESICEQAFAACTSLKTVEFEPNDSLTLGTYIFSDSAIESIDLSMLNLTTLPSGMLYYCELLTSVKLPDTIKTIGSYAFCATNIQSFTCPDSLKYIERNAFENCVNLESVEFNNGLTAIRQYAFYNTGLKSLTFPSTLKSIAKNAFYECFELSEINLNNGLTTISDYAFEGCAVSTLEIPSTVSTIGVYAFSSCESLESLTLNEGLTKIGNYAFAGCGKIKQLNIPSTVNSIGDSAFQFNHALESLTFNDDGINRMTIGANAFFNDYGLKTSLVFTPNISEIGAKAFAKSGITGIEFQTAEDENGEIYGLTRLSYSAFDDTAIKSIPYPSTLQMCNIDFAGSNVKTVDLTNVKFENNIIPDNYFMNATNIEYIVIPEGIEGLGNRIFEGCTSLRAVTLPSTLKKIGNRAFLNCEKLGAISIPESVDTIGSHAFYNCKSLSDFRFEGESSITRIERYTFYNSIISNFVLPKNVTYIGEYAFSNSGVAIKEIPSTVCYVGERAFECCGALTEMNFDASVNFSSCGLHIFDNCPGIDVFTFGEHCQNVRQLFNNACCVKEIYVNADVVDFDDTTFSNLDKLTTVVINSPITRVPANAFKYCDSLENVVLPETVTTIDSYAFGKCVALKEIDIPAQVTEIGEYAFWECNYLERVNGAENLETIGDYAFKFTYRLENADFVKNASKIGANAFDNSGITSVTFNSPNLKTTNINTFINCSNLSNVTFGENCALETVGNNAFTNCKKLTKLELPNTVRNIGTTILSGTPVEELSLTGDYDKVIDKRAFFENAYLKSIDLSNGSVMINDDAFNKCTNLETVIMPNTCKGIRNYAFAKTAISSIKIPDGFNSISSYAFSSCSNLKKVDFTNSNISYISNYAFYGTALTSLNNLPATIQEIGNGAFKDSKITYATIPGNCKTVYPWAFANCPLNTVTICSRTVNLNQTSIFYSSENASTSGTIRGFYGSTAETFAKNYGMSFVSIDLDNGADLPYIEKEGVWKNGTFKYGSFDNKTMYLYIEGKGALDTTSFYDSNRIVKIDIKEIMKNSDAIYICNGITSIPDSFMYDDDGTNYKTTPYSRVRELYLPSTLESIGANAFRGNMINSIDIPDNVKHIGEYAFANSYLYFGITVGSGMTTVTPYSFYKTQASTIAVKHGVERLDKACFGATSFKEIHLPNSISYIYENPDKRTESAFGFTMDTSNGCGGKVYCKRFTVPYEYAERYINLNFALELDTSVNLTHPDSYDASGSINVGTTMGGWFYVASSKTIYFIGNGYIWANKNTSFENLDIETVVFEYGITSIATNGVSVLEAINPKYVHLPTSITSITDSTFNGCSNLKSIVIPDSITSLTRGVFGGCRNLEFIRFSDAMTEIPSSICKMMKKLEYVDLQTGINTINTYAFQYCTSLKEIVIPDTTTRINAGAFNKCISMESITLGSGLTFIGQNAFGDCVLCDTVIVKSADASSSLTDYKTYKPFVNLGSATVGVNLVFADNIEIADFDIYSDIKINKVKIGKKINEVRSIKALPYLEEVEVDSDNTSLYSYNDCLYSNSNILILAPARLEKVVIRDDTVEIGESAFASSIITTISIPSSVKVIGQNAFKDCVYLDKVATAKGLQTIKESAFEGCTKLRTFNMPVGIMNIGNRAFANCTALSAVIPQKSIISLGDEAFMGCSSLAGIVFLEELESIGARCFANCSSLEYAYIWYNTLIGDDAFLNDDKLTIHTMAGSDAYRYARENGIAYSAYTDEDLFAYESGLKINVIAGYVGYCEENGHGDIQWLTVYEADCENDGYIIGVCEYCSMILEQKHIDATGHNYKLTADVPATSTTRGMKVYVCSNCGERYCEYIEPTGEDINIETHTVSGRVVLATDKKATTGKTPAKNVKLQIDGITIATTDSDGMFKVLLETGSYEVDLIYSYGFKRTVYIVVENSDINFEQDIAIIGCDFNKDGKIDDDDLALFQMIISSSANDPSYLSYVDLNNDGYINAKDRAYIMACKGIDAKTFEYQSIIIKN